MLDKASQVVGRCVRTVNPAVRSEPTLTLALALALGSAAAVPSLHKHARRSTMFRAGPAQLTAGLLCLNGFPGCLCEVLGFDTPQNTTRRSCTTCSRPL